MPNLLKMAAAQATRVLYVVGNRVEWQSVAVFTLAAKRQLPWSARDWLGVNHIVAAK